MSRATCWPVLADPLSGCRQPGAIATADALLRTGPARQWEPDVVVRMGAPWASRVVNEWLAGLGCLQVLVDPGQEWAAPDRLPAEVVITTPAALCRAMAAAASTAFTEEVAFGPRGDWHRRWSLAEKMAQGAIDAALAGEQALTEPAIARTVVSSLPAGSALMVSSSMPVRDVEWWAKPRDGVRFLSNRGASGIDGVLSTALGVASARKGAPSTCALVGDLAFLHDAGALLKAADRGVDLDVVVVDNDGGGIFNFLPQASNQPPERFERLWGTPQGADLAAIARAYGASTEEVPDLHQLGTALAASKPGNGLRVFLARTDRAANVTVHNRLHSAVAAAVEGLA
jgi:2-succinyl-5-enolpyruvyl-6-hydroxy-3-cyclohexene-1-carboxylate synthase